MRTQLAAALLAVAASVVVVHGSDPTAIYARVDRVILEPTRGSPEAIQMWGVFSMAKPDDRNYYLAAARGYLYFKLPADGPTGDREAALKEWADFGEVASTGQIVSFGSRYRLKARLREPSERPEAPDPYVVSLGVTKVRGNTEYTPIRALLDYRH